MENQIEIPNNLIFNFNKRSQKKLSFKIRGRKKEKSKEIFAEKVMVEFSDSWPIENFFLFLCRHNIHVTKFEVYRREKKKKRNREKNS